MTPVFSTSFKHLNSFIFSRFLLVFPKSQSIIILCGYFMAHRTCKAISMFWKPLNKILIKILSLQHIIYVSINWREKGQCWEHLYFNHPCIEVLPGSLTPLCMANARSGVSYKRMNLCIGQRTTLYNTLMGWGGL